MRNTPDPVEIARNLMERHGLRAGAVAEQAANEANLAGRTVDLDRWEAVRMAIADLRHSATRAAPAGA